MTQRTDLRRLVDEILESRTIYETIRFLKLHGHREDEIKKELRRRHGLNDLQASQALREYQKNQGEESG